MDFELTEEQQMLRDTVGDMLSKAYDVEKLREVTDTERGWSEDVWKSLADIGILGLTFAEDAGGVGAGPVEVGAVMTEIGRALSPEPLLDSVIVPGMLLDIADDETADPLREQLASGSLLMAFAHQEAGDRWPAAAIATTASGSSLSGTKTLVAHGDCANKLIVSAREGDTVGLYLVDADADGVTRTPYRTQDRRRGAQISFDGAQATRLGDGDAAEAIARTEIAIQAALCAEAVGAMGKALDLTVDYLKTRKQFGVTLSTFEALTHRAADMYVLLELARSMSEYATYSLADGVADSMVASRAKLQICRSARTIGQEAIQMHGGIGMTAEYPVGHYVARLVAISHTLGGAADHLGRLSANVGSYDMVTVG